MSRCREVFVVAGEVDSVTTGAFFPALGVGIWDLEVGIWELIPMSFHGTIPRNFTPQFLVRLKAGHYARRNARE